MSECVLVYGNFSGESFRVVEVSLTSEKRSELEEGGVKIPSLSGNSFQVKGDEKFVERMARGIGEEGVAIRTSEGSYSGKKPKAKILKERGGVTVMQVLNHLSFNL
ncbi:MAG: hypothetical protein WC435_04030 [Candidatus Paceibacterota bacterium]